MSLAAFDTLAYTKRLVAAGVPTKQAEAQVELQAQIFSDVLLERLATKEDFNELDAKIGHVESSLNARIDKVESGLNAKIDKVEVELRSEIRQQTAVSNEKFTLVYWMMGFLLSSNMGILLKLFHT